MSIDARLAHRLGIVPESNVVVMLSNGIGSAHQIAQPHLARLKPCSAATKIEHQFRAQHTPVRATTQR